MGFLEKIRKGLSKTKQNKGRGLSGLFAAFRGVDDEFFDELEERLILADVGVETSMKAVERLRAVTKERKLREAEEVRDALREILVEMLQVGDPFLNLETPLPISLKSGQTAPGRTSSASTRARTLPPSSTTASPRPGPRAATSSSSIPPDACTTRPI